MPSSLYTALLQALGINPDSVAATAWGKDYTLKDLENMTDRQLRVLNFKLRTYNMWMLIKLQGVRIHVWVLRNVLEFIVGVKTIFGL